MKDRKINDILDAIGRAQADGKLTGQLAYDLDKWRAWTMRAKEILTRIGEHDLSAVVRNDARELIRQLDL